MIRCSLGMFIYCLYVSNYPRVLHHKTADNIFERFTTIKVKVKLDDVGRVPNFVFGNKRIIVYVLYVLYIIFLQFDPFIKMWAPSVSPDK